MCKYLPPTMPLLVQMAPQISVTKALVPSHSLVDDPEERLYYWKALLTAWNVRDRGRVESPSFFPGSNPMSLSRSDLATFSCHPHLIAHKSDGVRYALFLTTRPYSEKDDPKPVALMIDRARNMFEVEVLASDKHFTEGTILEGELVRRPSTDDQTMLFLVFDAVCIRGASFLGSPFVQRLAAAERCVRWSEEISADSTPESRVAETGGIALVHFHPPVIMRAKRFVDAIYASSVWSSRADAGHRVDGLVIHRSDMAYVSGAARGSIYKWKPEHSIDLTGIAGALRAADALLGDKILGRSVQVDTSCIVAEHDDSVIEYHVDVHSPGVVRRFGMRRRTDKKTANAMRVIESTIRDAIEALSPDNIARAATHDAAS